MSDLTIVAITRFGTLTLMIFVANIFLGFYRYLMRLSAYHKARALALRLAFQCDKDEVKRFTALAAALNAETIDFEKSPATPAEQLAALLKAK